MSDAREKAVEELAATLHREYYRGACGSFAHAARRGARPAAGPLAARPAVGAIRPAAWHAPVPGYSRLVRHTALAALLLASCAPPLNDPDPPRPTVWTRDSAVEEPSPDTSAVEDTGSEPDTAPADTAPADTYAPPPDTAPADTGCKPGTMWSVCTGPDAGVLANLCGPAPDGCGASVDCGACTLQRRCARSPGDGVAGRCSCLHRIGDLCETSKGVAGVEYDCRAGDVPIDPRAEVIPQPDGKISRWCVP